MRVLTDFSQAGHGTDGEGGLKSIATRQVAVQKEHPPCANIMVRPLYP